MQLDPGPLPLLTASLDFGFPDDPGFGALVNDSFADYDALEPALDTFIPPDGSDLPDLEDDNLESDLEAANQINADAYGLVGQWQIAPLDQAWAEANVNLIGAYNNTPAEAWSPVPPSYSGTVVEPVLDNPGIGVAVINNLTTPGAATFTEGDQYQVCFDIDPTGLLVVQYYNVQIGWTVNVPATPDNQVIMGVTDTNGHLDWTGQFKPGDAGDYTATFWETTSAGKLLPGVTIKWTVVAAATLIAPSGVTRGRGPSSFGGAPPPPGGQRPATPVRVTLANLSGGDPTCFQVGDQWQLDVYGPAAQPVYITGQANGQQLARATLGQTDVAGHFQLLGTMSDAELGEWLEFYAVGSWPWNGTLAFSVIAGGACPPGGGGTLVA